jgi:hypothetical protein
MFRKELPRVYELRDQIEEPGSPSAFFQNLDDSLRVLPSKMRRFRALENDLQGFDLDSWEFFKKEALPCLTTRDETRGWHQLVCMLNQAPAYNYLKRIGCSSIRFVPPSSRAGVKTPDLQGVLDSTKVLCEVKTINISDKEATARHTGTGRETKAQLEQGFFNKLMSHLTQAKEQLEARDAGKEARRIAYIIINFDDFLAEYKEEYFQQIDQYLSNNTVLGIEIVFHNQVTCFHKTITMKSATVFNPDVLG